MNKYILHVDGDSFFASCEVSIRPHLRGKPVVVGKERSIATAMSYEAKALGVYRGMLTHEIRKMCPSAIILSSDYLLYRVFSERMFTILSRYTDIVEHYSIDECFADITESVHAAVRRARVGEEADASTAAEGGASMCADEKAREIGQAIKHTIETELGMTVSVGIGPSKVLAKIGSKKYKPSGFAFTSKSDISSFIDDLTVGKVWGIGPETSLWLNRKGIYTALEFISKDQRWIDGECGKHLRELWYELNGMSVLLVENHKNAEVVSTGFGRAGQSHGSVESDQKSLQRTRTFYPSTSNKAVLLSELSAHAEEACASLRAAGLTTSWISFFMKTKEFQYRRTETQLSEPTSLPQDIITVIKKKIDEIYDSRRMYRASGVTLGSLKPQSIDQGQLFIDTQGRAKKKSLVVIMQTVDRLDQRYGEDTVKLASSMRSKGKDDKRVGRRTGAKGVAAVKTVAVVHRKRLYLPELFLSKKI